MGQNQLRFPLSDLSSNQDKSPSWLAVAVEIDADKPGISSPVVFLIQLSIVFLKISKTDEVGARIVFSDFIAQARGIFASVRGWRGGNRLNEGK